MNQTLTALEGFSVGHWTDPVGQTGCTVILGPAEGFLASASFLGPSPGNREGILLSPEKRVERVHALLFTGGSAFGLGAAEGVVRYLEERGTGYLTPAGRVPIVPAAVIFDLMAGNPKARPGPENGYAAAWAASRDPVPMGRVGAGAGAMVGKYLGYGLSSPGGLGSALVEQSGVRVGALAVVNPAGDVYDLEGCLRAGPGRFDQYQPVDLYGQNTTLVAVGLEVALSKSEARMLADAAQTALARVIRPSHTPVDGDSVFVLSTTCRPAADLMLLTALAQEAVARAIVNAVA